MIKLSTQMMIVIVTGLVGFVGLILGLAVLADWSDGAIIGLATAFGAVFVNTALAIRNQAKTAQVLVDQDVKLDTITHQTNGMSEEERMDVARRAVAEYVRQQTGGAV